MYKISTARIILNEKFPLVWDIRKAGAGGIREGEKMLANHISDKGLTYKHTKTLKIQ